MGSTAVGYLIQQMSPRPYTLECTQRTLVSDNVCTLLLRTNIVILLCTTNAEYTHHKVMLLVTIEESFH